MVKEFTCNAGDARVEDLIPGWGRSPGGGHGTLLQYCCWENPMKRSLAGYGPWGGKELDTTEARAQHINPIMARSQWAADWKGRGF